MERVSTHVVVDSLQRKMCPRCAIVCHQANGICMQCMLGMFCPPGSVSRYGSARDNPCPLGKICVTPSHITDCPLGWYCPIGTFSVREAAVNCTLLADEHSIKGGFCGKDSSKGYKPDSVKALKERSVMQRCPEGSYCPTPTEKM